MIPVHGSADPELHDPPVGEDALVEAAFAEGLRQGARPGTLRGSSKY